MKKLFFYAAAAIAVLASCKKSEPVLSTPVDEDAPVAIQMNATMPTVSVTKTKAAVDAWDATTVNVYGVQTLEGVETTVFANQAVEVAEDGSINLVNEDDQNKPPYYYTEKALYDFYGYYADGAATATDEEKGVFAVEFDGSQDIMYAKADKSKDVKPGTTVSDLYSSWASRRGVQPTLVFDHALTRFDFEVIGAGNKCEAVRINKITVKSVNKGTLTVVGDDNGFVVDPDAAAVELSLKKLNDAEEEVDVDYAYANGASTGTGLEYPVTIATDDDALPTCLMVAPDMQTAEVAVYMSKKNTNEDGDVYYTELPAYTFDVNASAVTMEDGTSANLTEFLAGYKYTIKVKVYGPEEIVISAELNPWEYGGSTEFDPDDQFRPGAPAEEIVEETAKPVSVGSTATEEEYLASLPKSYTDNYDYEAAKATFPWIVASFEQVAAGDFSVKVFNNGVQVVVTPKLANWPDGAAVAADGTFTFTTTNAVSTICFEVVAELGLTEADIENLTMEVVYESNPAVVFEF